MLIQLVGKDYTTVMLTSGLQGHKLERGSLSLGALLRPLPAQQNPCQLYETHQP